MKLIKHLDFHSKAKARTDSKVVKGMQHCVIFSACVKGVVPQVKAICLTYCGGKSLVRGSGAKEKDNLRRKHCSAVYHLNHLNRDYCNLQPASLGCTITLVPLLCLLWKSLHGPSQLTELFVQFLHRE